MDTTSNSKSRRAERRKGCRRNRKMYGGNTGNTYSFAGSVDPMNPSLGNAARVVVSPGCATSPVDLNVTRPGYLPDAKIQGGLPGFAGGGRRRKGMNGGTYTFVPAVVSPNNIAVPQNVYQGCGEGRFTAHDPLNIAGPSVLTAPAPLIAAPTPFGYQQKGGRSRRSLRNRKLYGGDAGSAVYAADAMLYNAPRSGYSEGPSSGSTMAGPPFMIHTPYSPQPVPSPACLKTGGGSRKNKKAYTSKYKKASRKNKKASTRKNKKATRKNKKASTRKTKRN